MNDRTLDTTMILGMVIVFIVLTMRCLCRSGKAVGDTRREHMTNTTSQTTYTVTRNKFDMSYKTDCSKRELKSSQVNGYVLVRDFALPSNISSLVSVTIEGKLKYGGSQQIGNFDQTPWEIYLNDTKIGELNRSSGNADNSFENVSVTVAASDLGMTLSSNQVLTAKWRNCNSNKHAMIKGVKLHFNYMPTN